MGDEHIRLIVLSANETDGGVLDGIHHLRKVLSTSERTIRLVGLSGVGKTRLVQALFDKKIGEKALPDTQFIYAYLGTSPTPLPLARAEELSGSGEYSIMVVDNCSPELHRELVNVADGRKAECGRIDAVMQVANKRYELTEEQWVQVQGLIIHLKMGRPQKDDRIMPNAMPWMAAVAQGGRIFRNATGHGKRGIADFANGGVTVRLCAFLWC